VGEIFAEGDLLNFRLIWALQWDHIYTANYFLALMALLAASLAACSTTRQWPMVKVARRCLSNDHAHLNWLMLLEVQRSASWPPSELIFIWSTPTSLQ
jgi:cytochrome c biogenesis protein ResB